MLCQKLLFTAGVGKEYTPHQRDRNLALFAALVEAAAKGTMNPVSEKYVFINLITQGNSSLMVSCLHIQ